MDNEGYDDTVQVRDYHVEGQGNEVRVEGLQMIRERRTWKRVIDMRRRLLLRVFHLHQGISLNREKEVNLLEGVRYIVSRLTGSRPTTADKMILSTRHPEVAEPSRGQKKKVKRVSQEQTGLAKEGPQDPEFICQDTSSLPYSVVR